MSTNQSATQLVAKSTISHIHYEDLELREHFAIDLSDQMSFDNGYYRENYLDTMNEPIDFYAIDFEIFFSDLQLRRPSINLIPPHHLRLNINRRKGKCVICQKRIRYKQTIHKISCGHCFHRKCLDKWLKRSYTCPLCRLDLL